MSKLCVFTVFIISVISSECSTLKNIPCCENLQKRYLDLTDTSHTQNQRIANIREALDCQLADSNCSLSYIIAGDLSRQNNNDVLARDYYRKCWFKDSTNIYVNYVLGVLAERSTLNAEALAFYENAISLKTSNGYVIERGKHFNLQPGKPVFDVPYEDLLLRRAAVYVKVGNLEPAFLDLNFCIRANMFLNEAFRLRSKIYSLIDEGSKSKSDSLMASMYGSATILYDQLHGF